MKHSTNHNRIIIGCNEPALLNILSLALSQQGVEIDIARSHRELVRRCHSESYALIITRFVKPLLRDDSLALGGARGASLPPIFVLSHTHNQRIVVHLLERGVSQFLSLPISLARLSSKVAQQLHSYHAD